MKSAFSRKEMYFSLMLEGTSPCCQLHRTPYEGGNDPSDFQKFRDYSVIAKA